MGAVISMHVHTHTKIYNTKYKILLEFNNKFILH